MNARIVAIDDSEIERDYVRVALEDAGLGNLSFHDGPGSALKALTAGAETPELILTDFMMPGMNGIEFCARLRRLPSLAYVPIIMMTGSSDERILPAAFEAGVSDYIQRPCSVPEFVARVRNGLRITPCRLDRATLAMLTGSPPPPKAPTDRRAAWLQSLLDYAARARGRVERIGLVACRPDRYEAIKGATPAPKVNAMLKAVRGVLAGAAQERKALLLYAGGGTFVYAFPLEVDAPIDEVTQRIRTQLRRACLVADDGHGVGGVTFSLTWATPRTAEDIEPRVRNLIDAVGEVSRAGGDRVRRAYMRFATYD